jgi:hypothetical protein
MLARVLAMTVMCAVGCAKGGSNTVTIIDADDDRGDDDADTDAPSRRHPDTPPPSMGAKLLITEIALAPSPGEFVEILNPGAVDVSLRNYYLSDHSSYFRLPTGAPTVDTGDFLAQFPSTATIAAGGVATIAISTAADFTTTYPGIDPSFSLGAGTNQMTIVSSNGVPTLTNGGEMVALFFWDGENDLVQDCDLMLAGVPTAANSLVTRTGVQQDGPDSDMVTTAYANDALTIAPQPTEPASGKSTKRIALEAGNQLANGNGNGVTGDDETSENTAMTWDTTYTAPTPGQVPIALQ